jgi:hypothetical protein
VARQRMLEGVIDLHVHCAPDSQPRKMDAIDLAQMANERGMRGFVLKNHHEPTASLAYMVRKVVPGLEAFGGVTLNRSVGGINPAAVESMAKLEGGYGRFVWMGSFDSEAHVRYRREERPFVAVSSQDRLLPETKAVIDMIARHRLILSTGHSTPREVLMMVEEARLQRVKHIVVTHAMMMPTHMSAAGMREAAARGAFIEFVYNGLIGPYKEFEISDYAEAIQAVGAAHCILTTDLGQVVNPPHTDGMESFIEGLLQQGMGQTEIDVMTKENPARLLDLV